MRLLLAEDERALSDALSAILSHANYSVDAVYDGQEALDYLRETEYDGVILDLMLPKIDGMSVLQKLRDAGNTVPVLILSAKSEIEDRVAGLDLGADDYLTKPFSSQELLARVRAITRRQPSLRDTDLRAGSLTLSRTDYMLRGPDGQVRLGNKEYQLMEMLMLNPDQVISSERFLEKIWGYDTEAELNVVWVNLSSLRKKIRAVGGGVSIRANRGLGYKLEVTE